MRLQVRVSGMGNRRGASWCAALVALLVCVPTSPQARERVFYFHNDHLGTPQVLTDESGATVWQVEMEPFGEAVVDEDADGDGVPVVNNLRFPGQYFDAETGLHYNYHRDYDPATGRYVEPDPIGIETGQHLYAYVENNPIGSLDKLGLSGADVTKIFNTYRVAVDRMTERELRKRNGLLGNFLRMLYDTTGGRVGHDYYLCHEQTDFVIVLLESDIYDDYWNFVPQYRTLPPHVWGKATSSNPCDPDIEFDPWRDVIKTVAK